MKQPKDNSKKASRAWSLSPAILNDLFLTQQGSEAAETETNGQADAEASASAGRVGSSQAGSAQEAGVRSFPVNAPVPSLGANVATARVRAEKASPRPPVEGRGRGDVAGNDPSAALGSQADPSAPVVRGGRARRRPVVFFLGLLMGAGLVLAGILFFRSGEECGGWKVVYTGYGEVVCDGGAVNLHPTSAAQKKDTHAALVVAEAGGSGTVGATVKTTSQVRKGKPNPWEVGWFLFRYQDPSHFYAVVLKPNGWEISKQDPAYKGSQRFLASGDARKFPVGGSYKVTVEQKGPAQFAVSVDGEHLADVTDSERPYPSGSVALYTEDAAVTFTNIAKGS